MRAVLDVDGVLADVRHRVHHLHRRPKNWGAFFAAAGVDPVLPDGLSLARALAEDAEVLYLSGRPQYLKTVTERWLHRHDFPSGPVVLRPSHDMRPAAVLKPELLARLAEPEDVLVVVDDDLAVCRAMQAAGYRVHQARWALPDEAVVEAQERLGRT